MLSKTLQFNFMDIIMIRKIFFTLFFAGTIGITADARTCPDGETLYCERFGTCFCWTPPN